VRSLLRNPLFTIVTVLTLAICTGANTAVFSIVDGVLLKPLAYPNADRLVAVWHAAPGAGLAGVGGQLQTSASMYFTYAEHNRTFQNIGVWSRATVNVTGVGEPAEVRAVLISDGVLQSLGVPPHLGGWFAPADFDLSSTPKAILSYEYWQRRFGGDAAVIGRTITGNSVTAEIAGVMPKGFGIGDTQPDIIIPLRFDRSKLRLPTFDYFGVARLKPGVTLADANADIARMIPIWLDSWPPFPGGDPKFYTNVWRVGPALTPLKDDVIGNVGGVLWVVMGTIVAVLLIACANVTNLLLVRAQARERELAIRAALGGGQWRIARTLLVESVLLGLAGGALGVAIAYFALQAFLANGPVGLPRLSDIGLDVRSLAFTFAISLVAGLALGVVPALKHARPRTLAALHGGGRTSSQGLERTRAQDLLVVAQVALALVLLVGSGLMIRTFYSLRGVEPGFTHAAELQTIRIAIPAQLVPEPERVLQTQKEVIDALAALPSVSSVAFTTSMPMDGFNTAWDVVGIEDRPQDTASSTPPPVRRFKFVSPGLFKTAGTRIVAGRDFTWTDLDERKLVVLISASMARELWGEPAAALGKRIGGPPNWREIIGVVEDVRDNGLNEPAPTIVYWPSYMFAGSAAAPAVVMRSVTFVIRSPLAGTQSLLQGVQRAVWSVNANLPVATVRTMEDVYRQSLARTSFTLVMLGAAGSVALALGVLGLYGVLSYAVSQRRREIAIRMALGAQERQVRRRFLRYGVVLALVGVALGFVAAAIVTRLMTSLLVDVTPLDPATYAAAGLLLTAVAALASYLPARRAAAVNPADVLAGE
jgi:predicted permease